MSTNQTGNVPPTPPPPPSTPPGATGPEGIETNKDAQQLAMLAHLLGIVSGFLGALIIWIIKKDVPFVEDQSKEALNFQLTVLIASLVLGIPTCGVGAMAVAVASIVFCILAGVQANQGVRYRYPLTLRLIK